MAERVAKWRSLAFPFGSEFPWDSTGYEEVHAWLRAFGRAADAAQTAQSILAFVTLSPHWAFSGSARRYWDFAINGKLSLGNERELHHYAGTLNALPLVAEYEAAPERALLLRLGGAATLGALTTIDPATGFVSMAWHGDPSLLARDGYSADFGPGFFGGALLSRATVAYHEPFGWVCMLCDFATRPEAAAEAAAAAAGGSGRSEADDGEADDDAAALPVLLDAAPDGVGAAALPRVDVLPRDAYRRRLFLAPLALLATTDGAAIARAALGAPRAGCARLALTPEPAGTRRATLELELTAANADRTVAELRVRCCARDGTQCARRVALATTPARIEVELAERGSTHVDVCWAAAVEPAAAAGGAGAGARPAY
jgi:hypothetical protein